MQTHWHQKFFLVFLFSAFSKACYQTIYASWRWRAIGYYCLVLAISTALVSVTAHRNMRTLYHEIALQMSRSLPILTIQNGLAKTTKTEPFFVTVPGGQWQVGVFATQKSYPEFATSPQLFLVGPRGVWVKHFTSGTSVFHPYPVQERALKYGPAEYQALFQKAESTAITLLMVIFFFFAWSTSFFLLLIINLIYTGISKSFSVGTKQRHRFWPLYYSTLVGMTVPLIFSSLGYAIFGFHLWLVLFYLSAFLIYTLAVNIFTAQRAHREGN